MLKLGLGTAAIGRPHYINIRLNPNSYTTLEDFKQQGYQILNHAYSLGIRYFDTAPGYGIAEQMIISWLKEYKHTDVEIATKWGYTYVANFQKNTEIHEIKEHSLNKLLEQWEQSKNLFPNLSSHQIHSATLESGVLENEQVLQQLNKLKNEYGLLIGLTSSGHNQLEILKRAIDIEIENKPLFNVFQVTYNLLDQSLKNICLELAAENKRVIIKEALANGRVFRNKNYPQHSLLYDTLEKIGTNYDVGVDAIALRYCMDTLKPYMVLSGASSTFQLSENSKSLEFTLKEDELSQLSMFTVSPEMYWKERKLLSWN
jgi:aryl-alcohol dehydrogenase-like predicted oxidoreductase